MSKKIGKVIVFLIVMAVLMGIGYYLMTEGIPTHATSVFWRP